MIVVRIEMWPHGDATEKRELAAIAIANVGGDSEVGNYAYAVSHQIDSVHGGEWPGLDEFARRSLAQVGKLADREAPFAEKRPPGAWKRGRLDGFERRLGVVKLIAAVLRKARL